MNVTEKPKILEIKNYSLSFHMYDAGLRKRKQQVLTNLNLEVRAGEIMAIIGSSGSGKSLLAQGIIGILPPNGEVSGTIHYRGEKLTKSRRKSLLGNEIAYIPQSVNYLDPLMKVGRQISYSDAKRRSEVMERYSLNESVAAMYPHQLSGGMARRVLIASAVIGDAKLILADEPTPGLSGELIHETIQNFRDLADRGCSIILITHDIDLALRAADRTAVFYSGTILEVAPAEDFLYKPENLRHPYSKALWNAMPQNGFSAPSGTGTNIPSTNASECIYASKCHARTSVCKGKVLMRPLRGGEVCCLNAT